MDLGTFNLTNKIYCGQGWVYHSRPPLNGRKGNAFRYPIMNLLIPISDKTEAILREMTEKTFFSLDARDYLDGKNGSLESVVRDFLKENINYSPDRIWLQTLPKMWGYSFNPVSFWFCYKGEKLDAVLCEVNNTFGDRHYYFVKEQDGSPLSKKVLPKNFHVSPFFPISGHYRFEFKDIGKTSDIGIRLFEGETLSLDTRIKLDLQPLSQISKWTLLRRYGWLTLMVIIRIHLQALRLWKKRTSFFKRPMPPKEKISL